jgi:hypothetical protein
MAFEKRDMWVIGTGIILSVLFFGLTIYFRSGAF